MDSKEPESTGKRMADSRYRLFDPGDPYETKAGPFFWRKREGRLQFAFRADAGHCNSGGVVHGGLLMTFADLMLCGTAIEGGTDSGVFTVSFNAEFVDSGQVGDFIKARAEIVRAARRLIFVRGELYTDASVILTCSAVLRRLR